MWVPGCIVTLKDAIRFRRGVKISALKSHKKDVLMVLDHSGLFLFFLDFKICTCYLVFVYYWIWNIVLQRDTQPPQSGGFSFG
jgi:hypothetical protein